MRALHFALFALAVPVGCDPGDFGAALDRAPVQVVGRPDGFGSNGGRMLLALAPPTDRPKKAARLLFAGTESPSLAVADFDGDGKPQVQLASKEDLTSIGLNPGQGGVSSAALLNTGTIALGMPGHIGILGESSPVGRVAFISLSRDPSGSLDFQTAILPNDGRATDGGTSTLPRGHFGLAVARGLVTQTVTDEVIVISDNGVDVLAVPGGVLANTTCTGYLKTPPDLYRSLVVADFLPGGNQEIAVGLPVAGGRGTVVLLRYGVDPSKPSGVPGLFCAGQPLAVPDPVGNPAGAGFGTALAAVPDLNGDGLAELVVGAPPDRAYLFYSPFDGGTPAKVFSKVDTVSEFGQRVALVDIDGDGVKELAITALQANVGQTPKAGEVLVYKLAGDGRLPVATLYDNNPTGYTEFFGIGLADLEFDSRRACAKGRDAHLLVAGADAGIFTFFRFVGSGPDPRCFAQK